MDNNQNQQLGVDGKQPQQQQHLHLLENFQIAIICKICNKVIVIDHQQLLIDHDNTCLSNIECCSQPKIPLSLITKQHQNFRSTINDQQQNGQINSRETQEVIKKQQLISEFIHQILSYGKLAEGTKIQYQQPLNQFFKIQMANNQTNKPTSTDIIQFLCNNKVSNVMICSLMRMKKALHIDLSPYQLEVIKEIKDSAKEGIQKNCHQVWEIVIIQNFINDLCQLKRGLTAFRIYILYYLASRISELKQIDFQMLKKGIKYVPQKQKKNGVASERNFSLPLDVVNKVELFQQRNQIADHQRLDIGYKGKSISSHSFEKELKNSIQKIVRKNMNIQHQTYGIFLKQFKLHDLRYSRIYHMYQQGADLEQIQRFIMHKSTKTTFRYLAGWKRISVNIKSQERDPANKNILQIKFEGLRDMAYINQCEQQPIQIENEILIL